MGEVWKAEDSQLRRTVALKFISSGAVDAETTARLVREARASAALDHPNICQVYGIHEEAGRTFVALAFIDGPSLAAKIEERPLPLNEVLDVAIQSAEGLQEAHEKGIVHRDIKPQNIMLTQKGQVKIMDFGLAAMAEQTRLTKSGAMLGTPAYMSPEQAQGGAVDHRTDIWALGVVLYEMLAGRHPFAGEYEQAIVYSIINESPEPITSLRAGLPMELEFTLGKALAKDVDSRYQNISELVVDLRTLAEKVKSVKATNLKVAANNELSSTKSRENASPMPASASSVSRRVVWALAPVVGALLIALVALTTKFSESTSVQSIEFTIGAPPGTEGYHTFALSPDGRWLAVAAYTNRAGNNTELWVRPLSRDEYRRLDDTADAKFPFWSPQSDQIGYFAEGKLLKVAVTGGGSQTLCDASNGRGGTWNRDGRILFAPVIGTLSQVSERGGQPEALIPSGDDEDVGRYPWFLPDGRRFVSHFQGTDPQSFVAIASLDEPGGVLLLDNASRAVVAPGRNGATDHLLFGRGGSILAQPIDRKSLKLIGGAFPIAEGVSYFPHAGNVNLSASDGGFFAVGRRRDPVSQIAWLSSVGEIAGRLAEPREYGAGDISPTGDTLAVEILTAESQDVWLVDLGDGSANRFAAEDGYSTRPVWSPNGASVLYVLDTNSRGDGTRRFVERLLSGAIRSPPTFVSESDEPTRFRDHLPRKIADWTSLGLVVESFNKLGDDLALWKPGSASPEPLAEYDGADTEGRIAPDGRLLAYVSGITTREIWVQPLESGVQRWQISTGGGVNPYWSHDGRELYWLSADGKLMAASISWARAFRSSTPRVLADLGEGQTILRFYGPSPDGQRFLVGLAAGDPGSGDSITIKSNWYAEFLEPNQD